MTRRPKPKKERKQPRPVVIEVPLVTLRAIPDGATGQAACDKCGELPADPDQAMLGMGVTEGLTLAMYHICGPCFEEVEWGRVYAPSLDFGSPVLPLGEST